MISITPAEAAIEPITAKKSTIWKEIHIWILLLSGIVYFYRPLFLGEHFFFRDLHMHFLPQKQLLVDLVRAGNLPLWDPYLHGGQPFLANLNNMVLYPSNLLYFVLPLLTAFKLDIVLHFLFSGAAAYWLARVLHLPPMAALMAGAVYMFCGYILSLGNLLNRLAATPYLPLLLVVWHRYLLSGRKLWFILTAIFGLVQFLAGAPEWCVITWIFLLGWCLIFPGAVASALKRWLLLVTFVLALSAVQIVPFVEMIRESARAAASDYESFSGWSLHPKRLPELIFPNFFGYPYGLGSLEYWGERLEDKGFPYILSIYFGLIVLLLSFYGSCVKTVLPRRLQYFLMICLAGSLLFSLGRFFAPNRILYELLGELNRFRYPIKLLFAACLPVALLSAAAAESIFAGPHRLPNLARSMIALLTFVIISVGAILFFYPSAFNKAAFHYFQVRSSLMEAGLQSGMLHLGLIWFGFLLLLLLRRFETRKFAFAALVLLVICDLAIASRYLNQYAPAEFYSPTPQLASVVKSHLGHGRFFRTPNPSDIVIQLPARHVLYSSRWELSTLNNYLPAYFRIPVVFHENFDGLAPARIYQLALKTFKSSWESKIPLLAASGVKLILTTDSLDHPNIKLLGAFSSASNKKFFLYEHQKSIGRAVFVTEWEKAGNQSLEKIASPEFDPQRTVVMDQASNDASSCSCSDNHVTISARSANYMSLQTSTCCDGYIVFAETFYPGWKVYIDGQKTTVHEANFAYSAVFQSAGKHFVERIYRPSSFFIGSGISVVSALLLFLCLPGLKARDKVDQ